MSIRFNEETKQFILETESTCYQMQVDELGYLHHLYYGPRVGQNDMSYPYRIYDHGFSGNPYDKRHDRAFSLDSIAQEYTSFGAFSQRNRLAHLKFKLQPDSQGL